MQGHPSPTTCPTGAKPQTITGGISISSAGTSKARILPLKYEDHSMGYRPGVGARVKLDTCRRVPWEETEQQRECARVNACEMDKGRTLCWGWGAIT
jgi:hypothetical protein